MTLATRRWSGPTSSGVTPKISAAVARCTSSPAAKASSRRASGEVRHDAQLDLRIVGGDDAAAAGATKAARMRRPSAVRTGMFCRFGSELASRPVTRWPARSWYAPAGRVDHRGSLSV